MNWLKGLVAVGAKIWEGANGWKTVAGVAMTVGGVALCWTPAAPVAKEIVSAGVMLTVVGLTHKAAKKAEGGSDGGSKH